MSEGNPLLHAAAKFGAVGTLSYALDVAIFNALRIAPDGLASEPLVAKTLGVAAATVFAWVGSRYWTFRRTLRRDLVREFGEFVLVAAAGYAVNLLVLYVSHYVLGFTTLIADNIAGNVIGAALGAVFRFALYHLWVYSPRRALATGTATSDK